MTKINEANITAVRFEVQTESPTPPAVGYYLIYNREGSFYQMDSDGTESGLGGSVPTIDGVQVSGTFDLIPETSSNFEFDTEDWDTGTYWDSGLSLMDLPVELGGLFLCSVYIDWTSVNTGYRSAVISINYGLNIEEARMAMDVNRWTFSCLLNLADGDTVRLELFHDLETTLTDVNARLTLQRLTAIAGGGGGGGGGG